MYNVYLYVYFQELTGHLPAETPLNVGEEPPVIRRRVGTAFSLDADVVTNKDDTTTLELEVELQKQITNAAHKLASDKSVSRFVRKQRRHSFIKAQTKVCINSDEYINSAYPWYMI